MPRSVLEFLQKQFAQGPREGVPERRDNPRRACVAPAVLVPIDPVEGADEVARRDGVAIDISRTGVRVISKHHMDASSVRVRIPLTGGKRTVLQGSVVRRRKILGYHEYGIKFQHDPD